MARKPTEKQLYKMKNEWLHTYYEEVTPIELYRAVFPEGSFERAGHPEDAKANGVLTVIDGDKARNMLIFDELEAIKEVKGKEFVITSPVGYSGRNRTAENARWLYGIVIDLDGVGMQQLIDLFHQAKNGHLPQPTYTINSGHGLHLYYLLEQPMPLYKHLQEQLREFKYELISKIWNRYTSTYKERDEVQYQGIFQGFRVVGTQSKLGKHYPVRAFETGERTTIEELNGYLMDKSKAVTGFDYKSDLTLHEAKQRYPEWYERRIVQGKPKDRWSVKRDLYDWWLRQIRSGATVGHRYHCLSALAAYAVKCNIDEDELYSDALSLIPFLDDMSTDENNRFTQKDVMAAMHLYQESYVNFPRKEIERISGIQIPKNKRNGLKQKQHLYLARRRKEDMKAINIPMKAEEGRPSKQQQVQQYREEYPEASVSDIARALNMSRTTVFKWWKE